eukprot:g15946.t1
MANVGVHVISNAGGPDSIFEKLGGQSALEKFDRDTKKFFENRNLKNLKKRTVDYLGGLWGGAAYRGPDLFLAHTGLGVTVRIFDVMMKCAEKQLKVMKVALTGEAKPVEPQAAQEKVGAQAASPAPAAEEPSETESEGSDDSALNAHLVLLQGKTKDVVEKSEAEEKAGKGKDRLQQEKQRT